MWMERADTSSALVLCAAALLSGCQTLDKLRVEDSSARAYSATLISRPEEMRYGRGRAGQGGIEFAYERYRGDSVQFLDPTHYLRLERGTIVGPQTSSNAIDVQHGHAAYNHLFGAGGHFEFEPTIGIAYDRFKATAQGSAPGSLPLQSDGHKWNGMIALTPRLNFNQYLGIEVRFMASGDLKDTEITGVNPAFVLRPAPSIAFKAGYYTRNHRFETPGSQSNVTSQLSGFNGNITVVF